MEGRDLNFAPESEPKSPMLPPPPPTQPESQPQILLMPTMQPLPSGQPSVRPLAKPESTMAQPRASAEVKDGTPKEQKLQCRCNCKYSRCLMLYCDCFASGIYCDDCNCLKCCNNVENEPARQEAVEATLERNPIAFRPKIASSPHVETIEMPLREIGVPEELLTNFSKIDELQRKFSKNEELRRVFPSQHPPLR